VAAGGAGVPLGRCRCRSRAGTGRWRPGRWAVAAAACGAVVGATSARWFLAQLDGLQNFSLTILMPLLK